MSRKVVPVRRTPAALRVLRSPPRVLWIGAREPLPLPIHDGPVAAIDLVAWVCGDVLLDMTVAPAKGDPDALVESLRRALASKRAAAPTAVRVARAELAPALQRALGRSVVIEVAPTPDVGAVVAAFVAADDERGGADDPFELLALDETHRSEIARFCTAAAAVYRLAPWETLATDDDVMMFDAPELGLNRACITVTGQLRETFGVMWIASAQDYRRYRAGLAQREVGEGLPPVAMGLVTFEPLDDAPPALRKEILRRKWPLAGPAAMPYPVRLDTEGQHVPFRIEDVRLGTVIFEALAGFLTQHGEGVRSLLPASGWYPVASARGEVAIVVAYPHPDQTGPDDTGPDDLDDVDDPDDIDDPTCRMFAVAWRSEFAATHPRELAAAREAVAFAFLGRPAKATELDVVAPLQGSMVPVWASLWRPMRDGRTGLELAAENPDFARGPLASGRDRCAQARFLFGEAVRLDLARGTVTIRDLHDGVCYEILGPPPEQLADLHPWDALLRGDHPDRRPAMDLPQRAHGLIQVRADRPCDAGLPDAGGARGTSIASRCDRSVGPRARAASIRGHRVRRAPAHRRGGTPRPAAAAMIRRAHEPPPLGLRSTRRAHRAHRDARLRRRPRAVSALPAVDPRGDRRGGGVLIPHRGTPPPP